MGRSIYCSTCKKEKEPGRNNESRCKSCKSEAYKKRRAKKREDKGLLPFGSGRDPKCYSCKAIKENPKVGYCNSCRRQKDNENRLKTGITKKHQTGLCPCGNQRATPKEAYCLSCRNAQSAKWKRDNPQYYKKYAKERRARLLTMQAVYRGDLKKMPCEKCGTDINVEAHHDNYDKPFDIRWLCRKHHREHHRQVSHET